MSFLYLGATLMLLVVNLAALSLGLRCWLPHYLLAKAVGLVGLCLLGFFIEHFIGLGNITWLWPISTLISLTVLYQQREVFITRLWRQELVFVLALLAALAWKFSFPDIDSHSEQLTDLAFISSYLSGETLPPTDYWLPSQRLNMYYAFQHYAAALLGRGLGLSPGYTMNLAIALMLALLASLVWFVASQYCHRRSSRVLLLIAVMAGGTGIAPLTHFILPQSDQDKAFNAMSNLWANTRFAGMYDEHTQDTPLGRILFSPPSSAPTEARDLPLETIGYLVLLGDFHPPLGGFLLLLIALSCIVVLDTAAAGSSSRVLQMILTATVPVTLITNTWVFPLQAVLVCAWVVQRYLAKAPLEWRALLSGAVVSSVLIYPFLTPFATHALHTPLRWVTSVDHTPLDRFIAIHWPELVLLLLAAITAYRQRRYRGWVIVFGGLLILTELIYVDDPLGGKYNRFNSTLKWWSWLYPAIVVLFGAQLLAAQRWQRNLTLLVLVLIASFSFDMARYWLYANKSALGKLDGHAWLSADPVSGAMLQWLRVMPKGIVLEGLDGGAYTPRSALALFAAKPSLTGWPDHEAQWRGNPSEILQNANTAQAFYRGELTSAVTWLSGQQVRYIIWNKRDQDSHPTAWRRIHAQIQSEYYWKPFWQQGDVELGIWFRK
ncbi:MAG: hypothetical protein HY080_12550 [Gammaproteobacteria bacterium]|nr:hypothetical protein [Gammaproteobacteria bacterium]